MIVLSAAYATADCLSIGPVTTTRLTMSVSRPEKELLEKLCQKPETLKRALEILRIAKTKTAPGSGHELKSNVGLPAICALIASDE